MLELLGVGQSRQNTWAPRSTQPLAVCGNFGASLWGFVLFSPTRHSTPEPVWCSWVARGLAGNLQDACGQPHQRSGVLMLCCSCR